MFLNEEFLKIWEELDALNEAKADTEKLINFAGEELTNKFLAMKSKLKSPENDLYYWIKNKTPEELASFLDEVEGTKSNTQVKKEIADQGAELVCSTEHWNVYHITTFEASQKYGRDTKWCITGINNWGDKYWNEYKENGIDFYFLITKDKYDPRGTFSKVAIAIAPLTTGDYSCEVFNQQDTPIPLKQVPYIDEVKIPGLNLNTISNQIVCFECGDPVEYDDIMYGIRGECYCKDCFNIFYFTCSKCQKVDYNDICVYEDEHNNKFCHNCCSNYDLVKQAKTGLCYEISSNKPYKYFEGIINTKEQAKQRFYDLRAMVAGAEANAKVEIIDAVTGEVLFVNSYFEDDTLDEIFKMIDKTDALD